MFTAIATAINLCMLSTALKAVHTCIMQITLLKVIFTAKLNFEACKM